MQKIMFNDRYGLTDAVIKGRKTMTRRLVSDRLWEMWTDYDDFCNSVIGGIARDGTSVSREYYHECDFFKDKCRHKVGEIVSVAQSYENAGVDPEYPIEGMQFAKEHTGWRNKMFVSAKLMPHQIRITGVRCEQLQDISDEDCMREGCRQFTPDFPKNFPIHPTHFVVGNILKNTPREAFAALIDRTCGRGTWERNPWVVAYEFELVK